jgi:hypothetical protein
MSATKFVCPDGGTIPIEECLSTGGCRMASRCATRPFLRAISFDMERAWRGVSPSMAGTGPRCLYLRAIVDYAIDPRSRVWALLGISTHDRLNWKKYTKDALSEEKLGPEGKGGTPDVLEEDENEPGSYILTDYKTWGSYKVASAIGMDQVEEDILDEEGNQTFFKSGKRKGEKKTRKVWVCTPDSASLTGEEMQLNRYRIFFEEAGFPVSKMQILAIPRDGNTQMAHARGVSDTIYLIPIKRLDNDHVIGFYNTLTNEVTEAFETGWVRPCNKWESWDGRKCAKFCEVNQECAEMGTERKGR